jgi:hypothetical protein
MRGSRFRMEKLAMSLLAESFRPTLVFDIGGTSYQ